MIGCFNPISSITVFLASLKHFSSTSDADASIKWSSASVASSDSFCILDRCLWHNLEKKLWICMLDNHSVLSNILFPSIVQTVCIFLWISVPDLLRKPFTCTSLMKSPSHGKLWSTCQGFCGHCNQFSSPSNDNDWKWWIHYLFTES